MHSYTKQTRTALILYLTLFPLFFLFQNMGSHNVRLSVNTSAAKGKMERL